MKKISILFLLLANFSFAQTPLTNSLTCYWHLDGNGTEVVSGANIVITNSVTYGATYGKIYQGASFVNGSHSQLLANQNNAFVFGNGDFTVNCWVKKLGQARTQYFWGQSDAGGNNSSISVLANFTSADKVSCYYALPSTAVIITSTVATTDTNWHMVTQTRVGANGYLYFDAVQVATTSALSTTSLVSVNESWGIGCPGNLSTSFNDAIYGYVDEMAIWKGRGLSLSDIQKLYNSGVGLTYPFNFYGMFLLFN